MYFFKQAQCLAFNNEQQQYNVLEWRTMPSNKHANNVLLWSQSHACEQERWLVFEQEQCLSAEQDQCMPAEQKQHLVSEQDQCLVLEPEQHLEFEQKTDHSLELNKCLFLHKTHAFFDQEQCLS